MKTRFFFLVMIALTLSTITVSAQEVVKKKKKQGSKPTATELVVKTKKAAHPRKVKKN